MDVRADRMRPMDRTVLGDRYALVEALGSGGMARVYLAHDSVLERDVALKVLREHYADDEEFVERFRREAIHAASLNHPNVVQIYDQGRAEDGTYFMAMEYVPGGTLKERIIKGGPLDPHEAAGIASQVAEALAVAHQRGIVHRDIKPQNVLLTTSGEAKVADFGIARAVSASTMTEANLVLGTAAYMSPEQVGGERVGPQSDLYSLGVVLYEMLTGALPHRGDDPIATAMKHLNQPAPHPRDANSAVSEELDALSAKLLAKDPQERYSGAAALAEDLRRIRDGLSPLSVEEGDQPTVPVAGTTRQWTRTAPTMVAPDRGVSRPGGGGSTRWPTFLPLVALLIGVVLLGVFAWALLRGPSERDASPAGRPAGGAALIEIPNVKGLSPGEAQRRLESENLKLGSKDQAASDAAAEGSVIEQNPAAGTEARRGSAVDVRVGTGPSREPAMPSSPTASPSAPSTSSPGASPSASPATASPASDEDGAGEAAEEAQKAAEEAAKEREKAREEAQKRAEERQKAREEAREERQKAREEARKEAKE
jgi:eukaryotic-like serine/threonine-protein kinase